MATMVDSSELCAICCEVLTSVKTLTPGPSQDPNLGLTQCCREPICADCVKITSHQDLNSSFTCPTCQGHSQVVTIKPVQAQRHFITVLQSLHEKLTAIAEAALKQFQDDYIKVDELTDQMEANMTAVTTAVTVAVNSYCNQATSQINNHRRAHAKTVALIKADYQRLQRQAQAQIKYLTKLGSKLADLAKAAEASELLQLHYELTLIDDQDWPIPALPEYQPVRWFNQQLVVDDIKAQFAAISGYNDTPKPVVYEYLYAMLHTVLELGDIKETFVVESPSQLVELSKTVDSSTHSLPPHLTCYNCYHGCAVVDQQGRVRYHHKAERILAATPTWLVILVFGHGAVNGNGHGDVAESYLKVYNLAEALTESATPYLSISLPGLQYGLVIKLGYNSLSGQLMVEVSQPHGDQVLIWYLRLDYNHDLQSKSVCTFQAWALTPLQLLRQEDLSDGQIVWAYRNGVTVMSNRDWNWYYRCGDKTSLLPQFQDWKLLRDGSLLILKHLTTVLWRDSGEITVLSHSINFDQFETNSWNGRLVQTEFDQGNVRMKFY